MFDDFSEYSNLQNHWRVLFSFKSRSCEISPKSSNRREGLRRLLHSSPFCWGSVPVFFWDIQGGGGKNPITSSMGGTSNTSLFWTNWEERTFMAGSSQKKKTICITQNNIKNLTSYNLIKPQLTFRIFCTAQLEEVTKYGKLLLVFNIEANNLLFSPSWQQVKIEDLLYHICNV